MKRILSLTAAFLILISCSEEKKEEQISTTKSVAEKRLKDVLEKNSSDQKTYVDKAAIGMSINELREAYPHSEFIDEPVWKYGVDSEDYGLLLKNDNEEMFFVWTLQESDKIHGITILSNSITIDQNVHVGMTLKEFREKYPDSRVSIDMIDNSCEFSYVPEMSYRVEFITSDSSRVANYDYNQPEPEFIDVKRPEATIERISVN